MATMASFLAENFRRCYHVFVRMSHCSAPQHCANLFHSRGRLYTDCEYTQSMNRTRHYFRLSDPITVIIYNPRSSPDTELHCIYTVCDKSQYTPQSVPHTSQLFNFRMRDTGGAKKACGALRHYKLRARSSI